MRAFLILLLAILVPLTASARNLSGTFDRYLRARHALGHFNGTVLVARDGKILYERGIGMADFEDEVPAVRDTRFAIASLTKQFTAAAILQLRDAGKLGLDDSICLYLTPCPDAWRPVTIHTLLNHTSGVVDYEEPRELGSPAYIALVTQPDNIERIVAESAAKPLEFTPGMKWHYSNTGYVLLSKVISRVSGEPFADYIDRHILRVAGMHDSSVARPGLVRRLAHGYELRNLTLKQVAAGVDLRNPATLQPSVMGDFTGEHGDANLISTAGDLSRWIDALHEHRIISAASLGEMTTAGRASYGYGLEIAQRFGTKLISHTGGLPGFSSRLDWYPDKHLTVVVLSNVGGVRFSAVAKDLAAIALGEPYAVPAAHPIIDLPPASLQPWTGSYGVPGGTARIELKDGALYYHAPGGGSLLLMPESDTRFYVPLGEGSLVVTPGSGTAPTRLHLHFADNDVSGTKTE